MQNILTAFLSKLKKFDEDQIKAITENTQTEVFKKGDIIIKQGVISDKCYFVLKGCLRQYQIVNGTEKTMGFFLEGDPAILYSSYLHRKPSEYYIDCIEDCILITGTREQERELHKKHPNLEYLIHNILFEDYNKVEDYMALINGHKPEDRYLQLLKTRPELIHRVPLYQLASFIGVTPESFSRIRKRVMTKGKF